MLREQEINEIKNETKSKLMILKIICFYILWYLRELKIWIKILNLWK